MCCFVLTAFRDNQGYEISDKMLANHTFKSNDDVTAECTYCFPVLSVETRITVGVDPYQQVSSFEVDTAVVVGNSNNRAETKLRATTSKCTPHRKTA